MSRGLIRGARASLGLGLALAFAATASAAPDPYQRYLEKRPGVAAEDLLEPASGDSIARVLAVIYNPESGVGPRDVRVAELAASGVVERRADALAGEAGESAPGSYLVSVTQTCDAAPARGAEAAPGSWFYLPGNRLAAWQLQPFGAGCRREPALFEASDHETMRVVGETLFRPLARGSFRYGALVYDEWNDAFAAASREATVSQLRRDIASRPNDARAENRLAVALYAAGEREQALRALRRASELAPGWALPHRNLATVYLRLGDRAAAARETELADGSPGRDVASPPGK